MRRKYSKTVSILSAVVTFLAITVSSTASYVWFYQPKAPKSLQK